MGALLSRPLPATQHFLILGSTGVGVTTLMAGLQAHMDPQQQQQPLKVVDNNFVGKICKIRIPSTKTTSSSIPSPIPSSSSSTPPPPPPPQHDTSMKIFSYHVNRIYADDQALIRKYTWDGVVIVVDANNYTLFDGSHVIPNDLYEMNRIMLSNDVLLTTPVYIIMVGLGDMGACGEDPEPVRPHGLGREALWDAYHFGDVRYNRRWWWHCAKDKAALGCGGDVVKALVEWLENVGDFE